MRQIDKNTVSSKGQLKESEFVTFINPEGKGKRILFVGNSITRHGILHDIGWHTDCGMAASDIEKDYVHIVAREAGKVYEDAAFCICQLAVWERQYKNGNETYSMIEAARDFAADIIIMRCVENCPYGDLDHEAFNSQYKMLIDFLNASGKAEVIATSGFWKHPGDVEIEKVAKERGYKYIYLGDLGENDEMKAIGLFEHEGVANHPGDKGMQAIADRILEQIL